jgi:hypothetical protein
MAKRWRVRETIGGGYFFVLPGLSTIGIILAIAARSLTYLPARAGRFLLFFHSFFVFPALFHFSVIL